MGDRHREPGAQVRGWQLEPAAGQRLGQGHLRRQWQGVDRRHGRHSLRQHDHRLDQAFRTPVRRSSASPSIGRARCCGRWRPTGESCHAVDVSRAGSNTAGGGRGKEITVFACTPYVISLDDGIWKSAGANGWKRLTVVRPRGQRGTAGAAPRVSQKEPWRSRLNAPPHHSSWPTRVTPQRPPSRRRSCALRDASAAQWPPDARAAIDRRSPRR